MCTTSTRRLLEATGQHFSPSLQLEPTVYVAKEVVLVMGSFE